MKSSHDRLDDIFARNPPVDAIVSGRAGLGVYAAAPRYSIAVPKRPFKVPLAHVIAGRDAAMTSLVIRDRVETEGRYVDDLFSHWILGQDSAPAHRRWSVLHDVLHWLP